MMSASKKPTLQSDHLSHDNSCSFWAEVLQLPVHICHCPSKIVYILFCKSPAGGLQESLYFKFSAANAEDKGHALTYVSVKAQLKHSCNMPVMLLN